MKSRIEGDWPRPHTYTGVRRDARIEKIEDTGLVDLPGMREFLNLQFMYRMQGVVYSAAAKRNLHQDIVDARQRLRSALYGR